MTAELFTQPIPVGPLASVMRPDTLEHFVGQSHLLGQNKPLRRQIESGHWHSMLFWGPPGTGKTTLARIIGARADLEVALLSAVTAGVKDIRAVMAKAQQEKQRSGKPILLFLDEVHRFNKAQQDALLPDVESGTVIFIGATTENPSFEVNNALLSRSRVYLFKALTEAELIQVLSRACDQLLVAKGHVLWEEAQSVLAQLAQAADGDARCALNLLEQVFSLIEVDEYQQCQLTDSQLMDVLSGGLRQFDKGGDIFYDLISALHKSVRGSNPDAALYWFARMLDGGCDPLYIARRVVRMASEDIGNADPRALSLALNAWDVQERLGSPEGELALAQAVVYLACCAKSNAVYRAFNAALQDVKHYGTQAVPLHLRNAATQLMKSLGYSKGYRYAHDEAHGYAAGEHYFPEEMGERHYYEPVDRGLEIKIKEKLAELRKLDKEAT